MAKGRDSVKKNILLCNLDFLDVYESGQLNLSAVKLLERMQEVIDALSKIRKADPSFEKVIVEEAILKAYTHRINAYFALGKRNHIILARNDLIKVSELRPHSKSTKQAIADCDARLEPPPKLTKQVTERNLKKPKAVKAVRVEKVIARRDSGSKAHKSKKPAELKRQTSLPDLRTLRTLFAKAEKPKNDYQQVGGGHRFYQHKSQGRPMSQPSHHSSFTRVTQPGGKTGSGGSK